MYWSCACNRSSSAVCFSVLDFQSLHCSWWKGRKTTQPSFAGSHDGISNSLFHFLSLSSGHMSMCVWCCHILSVLNDSHAVRELMSAMLIMLWTCRGLCTVFEGKKVSNSADYFCLSLIKKGDGLTNCVRLCSLIVHWIILFFYQQWSRLSFNENLKRPVYSRWVGQRV